MTGSLYRQVIAYVCVVCLTAACGSQEPAGPSAKSSMEFSADLGTRAVPMTGDNLTAYPFTVFSDMLSIDHTSETKYISILDATEVSFDKYAHQWTYDNTQYWFPGFQYAFVAVHPGADPSLSEAEYQDNRLQLTYIQPSDYTQAPDLLISSHRRDCTSVNSEPVRFSFAHILTNVNVTISYRGMSSGPSSFTVDRLTFKNLPLKSTYSIKPAPLTGDTKMTSDWVNDEGTQQGWTVKERGELNIVFPEAAPRIVYANQGEFRLFSANDTLFLLPDPGKQDEPVELELHYITNTGVEETLTGTLPTGWNPGTSLNLEINIDNGVVQLGITVGDWTFGSATTTTVPRK